MADQHHEIELAVIIPVYNEEGCIKEVIIEWQSVLDKLKIDYRIVAYDDGSKDKSLEILRYLEQNIPQLDVITDSNKGHGPTILKGYRDHLHARWLFQVDSDGELKPQNFPLFWNERVDQDFIIGKRNRESNTLRKVITFFTYATIRATYGKGVYDINCPYRLMKRESFQDVLTRIPQTTFAPNVILSGYACWKKMNIKQIDISHQFRKTGEVSLRSFKVILVAFLSFRQTLQFRLKLVKR